MKYTYFMYVLVLVALFSCTDEGSTGDLNILSTSDSTFGNTGGISGNPVTGDVYAEYVENPFVDVSEQPISTFSVDADGASYANIRRYIQQDNQIPPHAAIRTEELINYFDLDYVHNNSGHPISLNGEVSTCPWNTDNKLIRIGIKGQELPQVISQPSNYVFLIDVSGSMSSEDKLELLKSGFKLLVDELGPDDRVAIVTYAGSAGVALQSTSGILKGKIKDAIDKLGAGGSTAGAQGIITAYDIAQSNFIQDGNNRVILGTDGDFNVGVSDRDELIKLIEGKRDMGIFLTVLGVGRGNLNDAALEQIANNGNGTYEYIDHIAQLRKVFIHDFSKFFTVAKDVKIQVEFNPFNVRAYRLIGYENRALNTEDFEDDEKDAGEIGANQNITALYEIVPEVTTASRALPSLTIDFRYKEPDSDSSLPLELEIFDSGAEFDQSTDFMKFTAGIASFAMLLRESEYKGSSSYANVLEWLNDTNLNDAHGFKEELKDLVELASGM